jgi:hypothetical protein
MTGYSFQLGRTSRRLPLHLRAPLAPLGFGLIFPCFWRHASSTAAPSA